MNSEINNWHQSSGIGLYCFGYLCKVTLLVLPHNYHWTFDTITMSNETQPAHRSSEISGNRHFLTNWTLVHKCMSVPASGFPITDTISPNSDNDNFTLHTNGFGIFSPFDSEWTNWLPLYTRHFQMHFLEWKLRYCHSNCNDISSTEDTLHLIHVLAWRRTIWFVLLLIEPVFSLQYVFQLKCLGPRYVIHISFLRPFLWSFPINAQTLWNRVFTS